MPPLQLPIRRGGEWDSAHRHGDHRRGALVYALKHHALDATESGMVVLHALDIAGQGYVAEPHRQPRERCELLPAGGGLRGGPTRDAEGGGRRRHRLRRRHLRTDILRALPRRNGLCVRRNPSCRRSRVLGRSSDDHQRIRADAPLHRPGGGEPRLRDLHRIGEPARLPQRRLRRRHPGRRGLGLHVPVASVERRGA